MRTNTMTILIIELAKELSLKNGILTALPPAKLFRRDRVPVTAVGNKRLSAEIISL